MNEKVEKAHQEALDEAKLCREILTVADPPSENEIEISRKQENLNAAPQKEAEAKEVMLKSARRFYTLYKNLLSDTA